MNEINETFTKQINGFECKTQINIDKYNLFTEGKFGIIIEVLFSISKNDKKINILYMSPEDFIVFGNKLYSNNLEDKRINYSNKASEDLCTKINEDNIWQILQDEWHKRFGDE